MLYDRINNLRLKRSPPDSDLNGGHDTDLRNKTNGRDVEDDGIRTVHNITASKIMPSTTHSKRANHNQVLNAPQNLTTTKRPWNTQVVAFPPLGPVQPTINIIPTVQVGIVPTGHRVSLFVGYYKPNHASEGGDDKEGKRVDIFLPRITTSFAAYFPQYVGYYYPWYTYGTEFNFPFYSSFKGYPQYQQQVPHPLPQTFTKPQRVPMAPQGQTVSRGEPAHSRNAYVVLYRSRPDGTRTVQYSHVPLDEVIRGVRRTASQILEFLSRRLGSSSGKYRERSDRATPGQDKTSARQRENSVGQPGKKDAQERDKKLQPQKLPKVRKEN
ncbi:uncharacterized protein LOC111271186 isoform X2 [Varroa jacobsoni]|nr:uncharacterized protein LOC111271186 isoform X2 [Varroa jacobsoni]